jgi:hypothetical protein
VLSGVHHSWWPCTRSRQLVFTSIEKVLVGVVAIGSGLAHSGSPPRTRDELLFDDVAWVDRANRDHFESVTKMRDRGVEVSSLLALELEADLLVIATDEDGVYANWWAPGNAASIR